MSASPCSRIVALALPLLAVAALAGCAGRPALIPNKDPELRRTSTQFAADAATRHPYPADAPRAGEADARAQVGYMLRRIDLINFADHDLTDVEVWINESYVVHVPALEQGRLKTVNFQMIYDSAGNYFPSGRRPAPVEKIEFYRDGMLWDVTTRVAD